MSPQAFNTVDACRLEVSVKPSTPYNLVANPSGALGAWGWVTPGASYMRRAVTLDALEHVSAAGAATVFYTEPMPIAAGQYAAAAASFPTIAPSAFTWQIEWLNGSQVSIGTAAASASIGAIGTYSRPAAQAPAGTAFFRLRFTQAGNGTIRLTSVRAVAAATAAETAASVVRNLIPNPSFEVDTATWSTLSPTTLERRTTFAATGAASGYLWKSTPNPGNVAIETVVPVTGGADYTGQARFRESVSGGFGQVRLTWQDSGGAPIGSLAYVLGPTTGNTAFGAPVAVTATAPPSAASCRFELRHTVPGPGNTAGVYVDSIAFTQTATAPAYFDGSNAASGTVSYSWEGTAHASVSRATNTDLTTLAAEEWRNILGPTHRISTVRESLNLGTMECELLDAALDPATSSTLRPGGGVRVLALVSSMWEPIFVGEIDRLLVTYDDKRRPIRPPRVSMTALDRTKRLTSAKRTSGVAAVASLPAIVEGAGVPWNVDGNTDQLLATPATVSVNDRGTALDQIALTRDSTGSHAWVDRKGVLVATTAAGASVRTLTEPRYSDLEVAFSSEACINAVEIESLYVVDAETPTGGVYGRSEVQLFGPYEDAKSIAQWGRRSKTFRVHGLTTAQVDALAASILTRNANPGVTVQSVALPMRDAADLADAVRDLGEIVTVSNTARALAPTLRINRVAHTIESAPQKWMLRLGFAPSGSVAAPTVPPEVGETRRGFEDTPWIAVGSNGSAWANGWSPLDNTTQEPPAFRRLNGEVIWRGMMKGGTTADDTVIITGVPAGFRPDPVSALAGKHLHTACAGSPGSAVLKVYADGTVRAGTPVSATWTSLAPIRYVAEK